MDDNRMIRLILMLTVIELAETVISTLTTVPCIGN